MERFLNSFYGISDSFIFENPSLYKLILLREAVKKYTDPSPDNIMLYWLNQKILSLEDTKQLN